MQQRYDFIKPTCFAAWSNLQFNYHERTSTFTGLNIRGSSNNGTVKTNSHLMH